MAIGVIITAFNAERWLADAITSVLGQTPRPIDILVLDDGSTDATAAIATRFGEPVRVVSQANAGIGAARNRGLELVRGGLLAFLDSDDLLTEASFALRLRVFEERPDVEVVFGHVRRFERALDGVPVPSSALQAGQVPGAILARRELFERVGKFRTDVRIAEGLDWLLRAREQGLVEVTVPEQVLWRRVHGDNNSLVSRDAIGEFAHALKWSLDRRRAAN